MITSYHKIGWLSSIYFFISDHAHAARQTQIAVAILPQTMVNTDALDMMPSIRSAAFDIAKIMLMINKIFDFIFSP